MTKSSNFLPSDVVLAAYLHAIVSTETGDNDQPSPEARLSDADRLQAWSACRNLVWALRRLQSDTADQELAAQIQTALDEHAEQLGIDLWLTRNGHGAGYWDRAELYGQPLTDILCALATVLGPHDVEFDESLEDN